jgi:ferrochelatase
MTKPDRLAFAGKDHPAVKPAKIGVVIGNLGTPDDTDYWSMRRYLSEFLSDQRVVELPKIFWQPLLQLVILTTRPKKSGAAYRSIWNEKKNESPLRTITRAQRDKLAVEVEKLFGDDVLVEFSMRYGNPSTDSVLQGLKERGCERIVFFPLYPQYSGATTATANDQAFRSLMKMRWQPSIRTVPAYYDNPLYIKALANSVRASLAEMDQEPDILVTSYHGVPKKFLDEGDPYHCHCQKTTRLLCEELGWERDKIMTTFQSKFGPAEWLKPATVTAVADLAKQGKTNIAIIAPAFSSDCVETLEEIKEEIFESFEEAGGHGFTYIPCLNDNDDHIDMMLDIIKRELSGWI